MFPGVGFHGTCQLYECLIEPRAFIGDDVHLLKTQLGRHSYLGEGVRVNNATIGRFCSIAPGVHIGTGDHPSKNFISTHPAFHLASSHLGRGFVLEDRYTACERTVIGSDVWLGLRSIILDGIRVGDGAIVGAGAVVTKDVAPYAVVAGVPARLLRYRFDQETIEFILGTRWWDKDDAWLAKHGHAFSDPATFRQALTA